MVSSGISNYIAVTRQTDLMAMGNGKSPAEDFGAIMAQSMNGDLANNVDAKNPVPMNNLNPEQTLNKLAVDVSRGDANSKINKASNDTKNSTSRTNASEDKKNTESVEKKPDSKVEAKTKDSAKDVASKIKDKIKEELNVADEDIENALQTLGLNILDLLDEGNLTDFVVEITGLESSVDLLVSADLQNVMDELAGMVETTLGELAEEFGVSEDVMEQMLKDAMEEEISARDLKNEGVLATEGPIVNEALQQSASEENVDEVSTKDDQSKQKDSEKSEVKEEFDIHSVEVKVAKTEGLSKSGQSMMDLSNNGQNNDFAANMMNQLVDAVAQSVEVSELTEAVNPTEIINQIVEAARVTLTQETTTMEMILNPEHLGKVNLNISVKEGVVTASLVAQNEAVKQAIENHLVVLKENLNQQGLKIEAVEVTVESHAFESGAQLGQNDAYSEQQQQAGKSHRNLRLDSLEDLNIEELTEEEQIVLDMMEQEGNQVNFKA